MNPEPWFMTTDHPAHCQRICGQGLTDGGEQAHMILSPDPCDLRSLEGSPEKIWEMGVTEEAKRILGRDSTSAHGFIHSFFLLFILQIFIACLLCSRHCRR